MKKQIRKKMFKDSFKKDPCLSLDDSSDQYNSHPRPAFTAVF